MVQLMDEEPFEVDQEVVARHVPPRERPGERGQQRNGARRQRKCVYNRQWQYRAHFRRWLAPGPTHETARCTVCGKIMKANLDIIKAHGRGQKHIERLARQPPIEENAAHLEQEEIEFKIEVARITIMIALFFARHRLPFCIVESFFELLINICPGNDALKAAKMGKTKLTNVTKWLANQHKANLKEILKRDKFSVLFDEATDISKQKHGAIVVRFFNSATNCATEALWDIISIFDNANRASVASAAVIYDRINLSFGNFVDIPRRNVISFCSDGCATMIGVVNSVSQRFRQFFRNIICITCPAHAIYLVGKGAYSILPAAIQELPRSVYNLFISPKRLDMLKKEQQRLRLPLHTIFRAPPTRWLVLGPAIRRLIEQWPALTNVINTLATANNGVRIVNEEQNNARINLTNLQGTMADPITQCYVKFLDDIVPLLENFNRKMQSTTTMLPYVYSEVELLLKTIVLRFTNENFVTSRADLINIDYRQIAEFINIDLLNIYIGEAAEQALQQVDPDLHMEFRNVCFNFYVSLVEEIKDRLEVQWRQYRNVDWMIPTNALSAQYHQEHFGLMNEMMALFSRAADEANFHINIGNLHEEWDNLLLIVLTEEVMNEHKTVEKFWIFLMDLQDPVSGEYMFRNLAKFAINICCIPHGNSEPERVWSREKIVKTCLRNRLSLAVEKSVMLLMDMLRLWGCYDNISHFNPPPEMIDGVMRKNYNPPRPRRNGQAEGLIDALVENLVGQEVGPVANEEEDEEMPFEEDENVDENDQWEDEWDSDELDAQEIERAILEFEGLE